MMSDEIIKVLDYITEKLGVAVDWTAENALPYVEEVIGKFVTYNIVYNTIGLLIGLLMLVVVIVTFAKIIDDYQKIIKTDEDNFWWEKSWSTPDLTTAGLIVLAFLIGGVVFGLVVIGINGSELMQWSIIPEIALLKEIKYLVG